MATLQGFLKPDLSGLILSQSARFCKGVSPVLPMNSTNDSHLYWLVGAWPADACEGAVSFVEGHRLKIPGNNRHASGLLHSGADTHCLCWDERRPKLPFHPCRHSILFQRPKKPIALAVRRCQTISQVARALPTVGRVKMGSVAGEHISRIMAGPESMLESPAVHFAT